MKKIIASVLCFSLCAGLFAGCDSSDSTTTTTTKKAETTTTAASSADDTTTESSADDTSASEESSEDETTVSTDEEHALSFGKGSQVIKVYAMSNEVPNMIGEFLAKYPDLDAKYKIDAMYCNNDNQGYETKLNAALKAGGDTAPDLYVAEADYILPYTRGDFEAYAADYKDFIDDLDNKIKTAGIAGYTVDLGSNSEGTLKALCYQCTGGAFIYRRSIAKEVFGSDDQKTVEAAIGAGTQSWDKFWEAAEKLKEKNIAIISGLGDIWNVCEKASSTPWVVDGKLKIDKSREEYIEIAKKLIDNGYTNDTTAWQPAWNADMINAGEKKVFGWFGPAWLINYVIAAQCKTDDKPDEAKGWGDFAVCVPPVGFWWGGSWLCANKNAVADDAKKEFIQKFIEWVTLDCTKDGLQYGWANQTLSITAAKDTVASDTVMKMSDGSMEFLGGQNPFQIFVDATSYASSKCKCEYDADLNGTFQNIVNEYAHGKIASVDDVKAKLKDAAEALDIDVSGV